MGMILVVTLLGVAFVVTSACQCYVRNWSLQYLEWSHRKHCVQAEISWSAFAITDVVTDLILLLFPVPMVWKLQLTLSKKISVLLVFFFGSFSTAIGITRMVVILYFTYGMEAPLTITAKSNCIYSYRNIRRVSRPTGYYLYGPNMEFNRSIRGNHRILPTLNTTPCLPIPG